MTRQITTIDEFGNIEITFTDLYEIEITEAEKYQIAQLDNQAVSEASKYPVSKIPNGKTVR